MKNGTRWAYVNGHVGFGDWHHQIVDKLTRAAQLQEIDAKALSNYALVNAAPAVTNHDVAWGHIHQGIPVFWQTNVDRNAVGEQVRAALDATERAHSVHDTVHSHVHEAKRSVFYDFAPWYMTEGHVIVGNYGDSFEDVGWEPGMVRGTLGLGGELTVHTGSSGWIDKGDNLNRVARVAEARFPGLPVRLSEATRSLVDATGGWE